MNILFHKMRTGKKGQIAAVLTVALVIFVISAFIVVNLGKPKIQKVKVQNAAESGVLAGGSAACVLLNTMANLNDNMVINFANFTIMMQFLLISYTIDYVKLLISAYATLVVYNVVSITQTALGLAAVIMTVESLILLMNGATHAGESIYKMISESNDDLPKSSRNSARQYAFSNAGVDEAKIPFSKSGCADAWSYSLLETKFDTFMRELPKKNKADTNYGTSVIEFDWDDSRTEHIINNRISVEVTPIAKLRLRIVTYGEVAGNPGMFLNYLNSKNGLGPLLFMVKLGVTLAPLFIVMIHATAILIIGLAVIFGLILAKLSLLLTAAVNALISCLVAAMGCFFAYAACAAACVLALLPPVVYYAGAVAAFAIMIPIAAAAGILMTIQMQQHPPEKIPCFAIEDGNNNHRIDVKVTRTTTPPSTDYGIYKTNWPVQSYAASGIVRGGTIFPPLQDYDIYPNF